MMAHGPRGTEISTHGSEHCGVLLEEAFVFWLSMFQACCLHVEIIFSTSFLPLVWVVNLLLLINL